MYKRTPYFAAGALVLAALSACGQQPTSQSSMAGMDHNTTAGTSASPAVSGAPRDSSAMAGMASPSPSASPATLSSMDHGSMNHGSMTGTATANAPFDALFIDSMIEHHQGAVTMSEQALAEAERPEITQLAQTIIAAQEPEITQMTAWREQWYADVPPTGGMRMDMGDMTVSGDESTPFDQRFMQAMIGHHEGAIEMARQAQQQAEQAEIKEFAGEIITAQEQEIGQMRQWLQAWYGVTQ